MTQLWRHPKQFLQEMIIKWEGEYQAHPQDRANWVGQMLVGTKYGVTPEAYANHFDTPLDLINEQVIKGLTIEEAVAIAYEQYYIVPKLDKLTWNPLIESVTDAGYNMGPGMAIRGLQGLLGTKKDGDIGPLTQGAYANYLSSHGPEFAAWAFYQWRVQYYAQIVSRRHEQAIFLNGWMSRAAWYTPGNEVWWVTEWKHQQGQSVTIQ